jgi:hypothetical protein
MLGLRFVDGRGRLINAGGQVVKNVAGYDLTRLMVGSAGTLGLITAVTLRMATRPQRCVAVSARGDLDVLSRLAVKATGSSLGAVFACAVPVNSGEAWRLSIGFEGFEETVSSQVEKARGILETEGLGDVEAAGYELLGGPFSETFACIAACPFIVRAAAPADRTAAAIAELRRACTLEAAWVDFGCGRVLAGTAGLAAGGFPELGRRLREATG